MIYAVKHNKVNRAIYKANEDALTSAIFERFMYLPKELTQHIFTEALLGSIPDLDLTKFKSITFWPNWSPEDTTNTTRVEPDVLIRTVNQDIIIEAKRYDAKQQSKTQWKNEIQAYYNEYSEDEKPLVFIALGGIHTTETENITVKDKNHLVYKCTWKSILNTVQNIIHDMELASNYTNNNIAITKILQDMILCFELFGFSTALWLERFIKAPQIQKQSINYFSTSWTN
ncbi:hypothetical protein [Polaribacter sargassicola]|uniref:hypothetical protein n=1 Tax=Polaribacter sargassicola TaxID=2836891 RepID=UPI001F3B6A08|nr:hypothetical protein [Polaribacter sp. DS7-9]MCG1035515.1 hypothetical protein [Polaribacter sp. DS7-9]